MQSCLTDGHTLSQHIIKGLFASFILIYFDMSMMVVGVAVNEKCKSHCQCEWVLAN